jgi:ribose-phosphate pyrophosphokinase
MANLINSQNYREVNIWDAHSDVTPALINRVVSTPVEDIISEVVANSSMYDRAIMNGRNTILVAPDAGSIKKISKVAQKFSYPMVRADKHRDVATGQITETVVYSENVGGKNFLIVDDICDGGRTFTELADKLRLLTTGKIMLYVTHGIFSKGLEVFEGKIDKIFCPNVFSTVQDHPILERM